MEVLFQDHMSYMAEKDTATFMQLIEVCFSGLQCDASVSALAAQCIDHIASYIVIHRYYCLLCLDRERERVQSFMFLYTVHLFTPV
jgi:hypothetical protein